MYRPIMTFFQSGLLVQPGILAFACLVTGFPILNAQENAFQKAETSLRVGNRLAAVEFYRKAFESNPAMQSVVKQYLPLISDYQPTTPYEETRALPIQNEEYVQHLKANLASSDRLDAVAEIARLAQERQIVILNEAHDAPQHRAFGLLLAMELRKIGFEFMAMETLKGPSGASGPVEFDYPTVDTGFYSSEPIFGDFVRQTALAGYQMVAYEIEPGQRKVNPQKDVNASIKERENAQSDNLIQHVLEKHKNAKLFIYVGYSHATENWQTLEDGSKLGWMAAQIAEKTGIDPLTIDQVGGSYNPKSNQIDPVFQLIQSEQALTQPSLLRDPNGAWLSSDRYYQKTDLTVFHPVQEMLDGRPNWLRMAGYRKPHTIENSEWFVEANTLVQAFIDAEGEDALPVDQLLLDSAKGSSTFLLPVGSYRTEIRTKDGSVKQGPTVVISE